MKDTLCIVASHPLAQRFDFIRTNCDVWGFNEALSMDWYKRADAVFQLHLEPIWRNPKNRNDPNHAKWLRNETGPCNACEGKGCQRCNNGEYKPTKRDGVTVFMQEAYDNIPNVEKYPLEEIKAMLPHFQWEAANKERGSHYLTSTVSMSIALGIYKGYKRIEVWGAEMNTDTEYRYQRDCVTFWQGVALGRGIEVMAMTDIYKAPIYGYEGEASVNYEEFDERIETLNKALEKYKEDFSQSRNVFLKAAEAYRVDFENESALANSLKELAKATYQLNLVDGSIQENERYKKRADAMLKETEGAFQFSRQEFEQAKMDAEREYRQAEIHNHALAGGCQQTLKRVIEEKSRIKKRTIFDKFLSVADQYVHSSAVVGVYAGAQQENRNYLSRLDVLIRAAGGEKSEEVLLNAEI